MLNLTAPRVLTSLIPFVLIGPAVARLYMCIPTVFPSVVKFRTWAFIDTYVVQSAGP